MEARKGMSLRRLVWLLALTVGLIWFLQTRF